MPQVLGGNTFLKPKMTIQLTNAIRIVEDGL